CFARTLGGVDVYFALRARLAGLHRAEVDGAVEERRTQVLPAARGCMYLVPKSAAALCLRVADHLSRKRNEKEAEKAGLRPGEVDEVAEAVHQVLAARGALSTAGIRSALPAGVLRSLGDAGKKVGLSSALGPALRVLEFAGRVERALEGGRLDS